MKKNIKSTLHQASKISLSGRPETIRGRLESNEFSDFYRFKVRSSSTVEVGLSGLKRNANVSLYRLTKPFQKVRQRLGGESFESLPSKRVNRFLNRVGNSRRPGKNKEAIEQSVESGTYLVRIFSRSRKGTRYRLSVVSSPQTTDLSELSAMPLTLSSTVQESLERDNPINLYEFALADRQRVNFDLSGLGADANLRLLDVERKEIAHSSNVGIVQESITKNLRQGTYFLEVSGDSTSYRLVSQASVQERLELYSGEGLLSQIGTVSPIQIPLPERQVTAIATALNIPLDLVPSSFISPREAREAISGDRLGTTLNTELFDEESTGFVGYMSHGLDSSSLEVVSVTPVPILDIDLFPLNSEIILDQNLGYTLDFSLTIEEIYVDDSDSSGLSLILIGDNGYGIEIGWTDSEILSRSSNLTVSDRSQFETIDSGEYSIEVFNDQYTFSVNDKELLSGDLEKYDFSPALAQPILPFNPYNAKNFIFLGDNSDTGVSKFTIEDISLYV